MAPRPFSSDAPLAVFGLVSDPDALPFGADFDFLGMFPDFPGVRLVPLGLMPIRELEVPAEVETLVVAPVERARFTDGKLKTLLNQLRGEERVRGLLLTGTKITQRALCSLRDHPWELLDLRDCDNLDSYYDPGIDLGVLKTLQSLRHLRLSRVPAAFLQGLTLPRLRSFEVGAVHGGEPDFSSLFRSSPLEFFTYGASLPPKVIETIAEAGLRGVSLVEQSLDDLTALRRGPLEALRAGFGTKPVEGFEALRHLDLGKLSWIATSFHGIGAGLDKLRSLSVRGALGNVRGVGPMPDVPALLLQGVALSEGDAGALEGLVRLEELSITSHRGETWTSGGLALPVRALERLPAPKRLKRLSLSHLACRPGDEDALAEFTSLESLSVIDVPLQLVDVVLEELTELRELQLAATWITDLAAHVTQPLRSLDVRSTPISCREQAALAAMPSLEQLALGDSCLCTSTRPPTGVRKSEAPIPRSPDSSVLRAISGHPRLHTLSIVCHAEVTHDELIELARSLPRLVAMDSGVDDTIPRAVGVKPPKLATLAQIKELRRMRREGLDDYEFSKACHAIWHDHMTIDEIMGMPRDEVGALLRCLEGY